MATDNIIIATTIDSIVFINWKNVSTCVGKHGNGKMASIVTTRAVAMSILRMRSNYQAIMLIGAATIGDRIIIMLHLATWDATTTATCTTDIKEGTGNAARGGSNVLSS